jgi:hypothetical protein
MLLGIAGLTLGLLMMWQSWEMIDPAWHTDAARGAWFNHLPPLLRTVLMLGLGALLLVVGVVNVWVVVHRSSALVVDAQGITAMRVLQSRIIVPWREIARLEEGKGRLLIHRSKAKPLIIGYDWFDAAPAELRAMIEGRWRESKQSR